MNAPIVLLLGTSTAGKTAISEEIQKKDQQLPESQRLNWEINGQDLWQQKNNLSNGKAIDAEFYKILENDNRFEGLKNVFEELPNKDDAPKIRKLYFPIMTGVLNWEKESLNLLKKDGQSEAEFKKEFDQNLDNFVEKTGGNFSKETLLSLQSITADKHEEFSKVPEKVDELQLREIFYEAIANSKNGKATIIDAAPLFKDRNAGDILKSCMEEKEHNCPTHVALIHLSVPDLINRMDERNSMAEARGKPEEIRKGFFPFNQYKGLFEAQKPDDEREIVGEVTRQNLTDAVDKFGQKNPKILENLLNNFGFSKDNPNEIEQPVKLVSICPYDSFHDTKSRESTAQIADFIINESSKPSLNIDADLKKIVPVQNAQKSTAIPELMVQKVSGSESSLMENPNIKELLDGMVETIITQQESSNSQMQNSGLEEEGDKGEELRSGEVVGKWTETVTANSKSSKGPEL